MSGIFGVVYLDGRPADRSDLARMAASMRHRGPDRQLIWSHGSAGMGHCMLHTTPESLQETLPAEHREGHLVITADARIDNRDDLCKHLVKRADGGTAVPDSELILRAYERWGDQCVDHLLGDFSFAIWDRRERQLICARDHFGIKPLYYASVPGRFFAFASEIKALLGLPGVTSELDDEYLADLLVLNLHNRGDPDATIYHQVRKVPSAHAFRIGSNGVRSRRYWSIQPRPLTRASDAECVEEFRELFTEAVRCRLRSAHPVASELSGGLDSSSVALTARNLLRQEGDGRPLHTVSLTFERFPDTDEQFFIREVLATGGFVPHYIPADDIGPLSCLKELFSFIDDPCWAGGAHALILRRFQAAEQAGARVLLTGYDGDSVVQDGYEYLYDVAAEGRWTDFAREARLAADHLRNAPDRHPAQETMAHPQGALSVFGERYLRWCAERGHYGRYLEGVRGISRHFRIPAHRIHRHYWRQLLVPRGVLAARRKLQKTKSDPAISLLRREFAERTGAAARMAPSSRGLTPDMPTIQERQLKFLRSSKLVYSLEGMNHYGAGCSLDVRHPFMDRRLIEFCLTLPARQRFGDGWSRLIQRRAMEDVLPEAVRWRSGKAAVTKPFLHGLLEVDREPLVQYTDKLGALLDTFVDGQALRALRDEALRTLGSGMDGKLVGNIGQVGAVSFWLKHHYIEREVSSPNHNNETDKVSPFRAHTAGPVIASHRNGHKGGSRDAAIPAVRAGGISTTQS